METAARRLGVWQAQTFRRETLRLERLQNRLEPANVSKLLARGFALVLGDDGRLVSRSAQTKDGDALRIALGEGWVDARVSARNAGEDPLPGRAGPPRDAGGEGSGGAPVDPPLRRR
jgi:exodeoxyribonuclease VII large subunit